MRICVYVIYIMCLHIHVYMYVVLTSEFLKSQATVKIFFDSLCRYINHQSEHLIQQ